MANRLIVENKHRQEFSTGIPAAVFVVISGVSGYIGAAIATSLFGTFGAPTVGWWRVLWAAVVLVLWRRPWRRRWSVRELGWAAVFGVVLGSMNIAFYVAISHLALGVAVSLEFTGPVLVALLTGRGWRERAAVGVGLAGVVLLAGVTLADARGVGELADATGAGNAFAGLIAAGVAATMWAIYIMLGKRVAVAGTGIDALALGMVVAAIVYAPLFAGTVSEVFLDARVLVMLALVGILASVLPYALDQLVLRRVATGTFAIWTAILPAVAAIVGAVALHQIPTPAELVGLTLVSVAIAMTGKVGNSN